VHIPLPGGRAGWRNGAAHVRHAEPSLLLSADDDHPPDAALIELGLAAAARAAMLDCGAVSARLHSPPFYPNIWPGEHYRLLAALVQHLSPRHIVEIGTATGLSALALKMFLPEDGLIDTFDLTPWTGFPDTCLRDDDFSDGRLAQHVADLSQLEVMRQYSSVLQNADLIFIDAGKDGAMEARFLDNFAAIGLPKEPLLIFDDIRLWNMLEIWRSIQMPKLDLTSFGHWSGTGLVRWTTEMR